MKTVGSDVESIRTETVWVPLTDYRELTGYSLQSFYTGLVLCCAIHWVVVAALSRGSHGVLNTTRRMLTVLNTLVCPPGGCDWDDLDEREKPFQER